eukprot:scaffold11693_cov115-Isochrysis_galbana.AAC.13
MSCPGSICVPLQASQARVAQWMLPLVIQHKGRATRGEEADAPRADTRTWLGASFVHRAALPRRVGKDARPRGRASEPSTKGYSCLRAGHCHYYLLEM